MAFLGADTDQVRTHGERWLQTLLSTEPEGLADLAKTSGANEGSLGALWRRLEPLRRFDFFSLEPSKGRDRAVTISWPNRASSSPSR